MFGAYLVSRVMCECVDCGVYAHGVEIGECHHESVCVIASRFTCGFPRAGYPVRKAVVVIIRYHGSRSCCVHPSSVVAELWGGRGHQARAHVCRDTRVSRVASRLSRRRRPSPDPVCHSGVGLTAHVSCNIVLFFEVGHLPAGRFHHSERDLFSISWSLCCSPN